MQGKEIFYTTTQSGFSIFSCKCIQIIKHNYNSCTKNLIRKKHIEDERKNLKVESNEIRA